MNGSKVKTALWLTLGVFFVAAAVVRYQRSDRPTATRNTSASARVAEKRPLVDAYGDPLPPGAILRLGTRRLRHREQIRQMLFSPDGKTLAAVSGGSDGDVRLWDVETGRLRHHLTGPDVSDHARVMIASMAFSPDGTKLVVNEDAGVLRLWDAVTGEEIYTFLGHQDIWVGRNFQVRFSPDGTMFASSGRDETVRVWDTETGRERFAFLMSQPNPQEERRLRRRRLNRRRSRRDRDRLVPSELAFSRDGRFLAAASEDPPAIEIWSLESGDSQAVIEDAHGTSLRYLAAASQPDRIVSIGWRFAPLTSEHNGGRPDFDVVPEVREWNVGSGELVNEREQHDLANSLRYGGRIALSQDGMTVAWTTRGSVRLRSLLSDETVRTFELPRLGRETAIALTPDASTVALTAGNSIQFWDAATGEQLHGELDVPWRWIRDVAYAAGGDAIVAAVNGELRGWDSEDGRQLYRQATPNGSSRGIRRLTVSPDGRMLACVRNTGRLNSEWVYRVEIRDAHTGELIQELAVENPVPGRPDLPTFSPDGKRLALQEDSRADDDRGANPFYHISLWDVPSGRKLCALRFPYGPQNNHRLEAMSFSSDSQLLYTVAGSGIVRAWDINTGQQRGEFLSDARLWNGKPIELGQSRADTAVFSNDMSLLLTSCDRHVVVWDPATAEKLRMIGTPGSGRARDFAISPDNKLVATIDSRGVDETIRVWDIETGRERLQLHPDDARARKVAFSPDGTRLVTSMDRGTIVVWDVTPALDP